MDTLTALRSFPALTTVPEDQLLWLLDRVEARTFPEGAQLYTPGEPVDELLLVLSGHIRIDVVSTNGADELVSYGPHSIVGLLPFSRMKGASNPAFVEEPVHALALHRRHHRAMVAQCYELTEAFVHQMTTRVRDFTRQMQQNEKLASLGRLSAGLAHELNNPVAAVVRSADTLQEHLRATPERFKAVMHLSLTDAQVDRVNDVFFRKLAEPPTRLSLLERSGREDELTDWLDDHAVDDSVDLAGPLVEAGFTVDDLEWVLAQIGEENLPGVLGWLVSNVVTDKLVRDIADASGRIATLVGSIKNYTHMDRGAGKDCVHLAEGIRSTLTLFGHKLRAKHIDVVTDIPDDLPPVEGWPGELNQVWSNLIDNALDALPDGGRLEIRSERDGEFVLTRVIDNGSGIPDDIKDNIFDPFFTTKSIGQGTGLGLDIVQGIIKHHNGSIRVQSVPGRTEFSVCLPVQ